MSSIPDTSREQSLLARAAHALRGQAAAHPNPWVTAHLEFSQAADSYSSRAYLMPPGSAPVRLETPQQAVESLAELRELQATPERGAWLSLILSIGAETDQLGVEVNHQERPYWNAPMLRMLLPADQEQPSPAVPSDQEWLEDLRRHPRAVDQVPAWLVLAAGEGTDPMPLPAAEDATATATATQIIPAEPAPTLAMPATAPDTAPAAPEEPGDRGGHAEPGIAASPDPHLPLAAQFRARLAEVGYPADAVILPGDTADHPPLEGAMEVSTIGREVTVGIRDYGELEIVHRAVDEPAAYTWLWEYLSLPLPAARPVPRTDLHQRVDAYRPTLAAFYEQVRHAGGPHLATLPPGVALDRIGAIDGVYLFPWGTPVPLRALPAESPDARLYQVLTAAPLEVEVEIVRPWFGQPGGALRFRIAADGVGVRQLILAGSLLEVTVGA